MRKNFDPKSFARVLLRWYAVNRRELPWRGERNSYRIWISEVMLQQTRVAVVRERYAAFLRRFPTVQKLARARLAEVLAAWSGLGYYRRARALHKAAKIIVSKHGGRMPHCEEQLKSLPGIGRYTAAAVASIAFDEPVALALSTTYWPMVWPSPEAVTLTVFTGESALTLPVRPPRPADADLRPFDDPACARPALRTPLREGRWENGSQRDFKTGRVTVTAVRDDGLVRVEANGLEIGSEMTERMSIVEGDPLSAETEMSRSYSIGRGAWQTRLEARMLVRCDRETFHTRSHLVAYEGEDKIFEREWRAAILRDGV